MRVTQRHDGKLFQFEEINGFAQKLRKCDDMRCRNAGRQESARSTDGAKIDGVMSGEGLLGSVVKIAFADETPQAGRQKCGKKWRHATTGESSDC